MRGADCIARHAQAEEDGNDGVRLYGDGPRGRTPAVAPTPIISTPTQRVAPTITASTGVMVKPLTQSTGVNPRIIKTTNDIDLTAEPEQRPLPVLEKEYLSTTNHDDRLDRMMDIAEQSTAEAVKSLARLFEAETDTELKVDLLDSLLGIEGFKDEKLGLLTQGIRQGLPLEVRQSAIDGLIDLEDTRSIALLNGLLNDPDQEIRGISPGRDRANSIASRSDPQTKVRCRRRAPTICRGARAELGEAGGALESAR